MMYIERLANYTEEQWKKVLSWFRAENRAEIKQILTLSSKESIQGSFFRLKQLWVINGIGANWMWKFCRGVITALFPWVRFEFHDIEYLIGGTDKDRDRADFGLFKYSILSIVYNYQRLHSLEIFFWVKELFIVLYTVFAIMKLLVLIIFWRLLIYFGGKAFNY